MGARSLAPGAEGFRVRELWGRRREREERRVRGAELGEVRREGKACPERGKRESRPGAQGAVPGVELLAVGECPHVVVAHEVAAAHGARALIRHEAPLDLQLRFGTQAQARHRRRLPGHPEQQQKQRRRRGPPAPGPEHHRGRRGEERGQGAERARARGARATRVGPGRSSVCKRGKDSRPSPGYSNHPLYPRPPATSERGEEPRPRVGGGGLAAPCTTPASPVPPIPLVGPAKRASSRSRDPSPREKS